MCLPSGVQPEIVQTSEPREREAARGAALGRHHVDLGVSLLVRDEGKGGAVGGKVGGEDIPRARREAPREAAGGAGTVQRSSSQRKTIVSPAIVAN